MEKEGLGREIEIYNEPADRETEPLLPLTPPAAPYEKFRVGREPQQLKRWIMPALFALKVSFWSLGMRGYRVWKYITYTLLVIVCAYYGFFKVYCADNPLQPYNHAPYAKWKSEHFTTHIKLPTFPMPYWLWLLSCHVWRLLVVVW